MLAKTLGVLAVEAVQVAPDRAPWRSRWGGARRLRRGGRPPARARHGAFSALGLLLAGTLRAEGTLAVANGIYLLLLVAGGAVIPADRLPGAARRRSSRCCRRRRSARGCATCSCDGEALPLGSVAILAAWAAVAGTLAVRTFRWS